MAKPFHLILVEKSSLPPSWIPLFAGKCADDDDNGVNGNLPSLGLKLSSSFATSKCDGRRRTIKREMQFAAS